MEQIIDAEGRGVYTVEQSLGRPVCGIWDVRCDWRLIASQSVTTRWRRVRTEIPDVVDAAHQQGLSERS